MTPHVRKKLFAWIGGAASVGAIVVWFAFRGSGWGALDAGFTDIFGVHVADDGGGEADTIALHDDAPPEETDSIDDPPVSSLAVPSSGKKTATSVASVQKIPPGTDPIVSPSIAAQLPVLPPASSTLHGASLSSSYPLSVASGSSSCAFPDAPRSGSGAIIVNEVAWMGSPSSSAAGSSGSNAEWMELKNVSQADVTLSEWSVEDATGKIMVRFGSDDRVTAGGFILLVRGSTTFPYAHVHEVPYAGTLPNTGDDVAVLDPSCAVSDFVAAEGGWPAGDNVLKETMERDASGAGWHTSAVSGGTPGGENSVPGPSTYPVQVSFEGSGGGSVTSMPGGLSCNSASCSGMFAAGSSVTLSAHAPSGSVFEGWSGACTGTGACTFAVSGPISAVASFRAPSSFNAATPVLDSASSSAAAGASSSPAATSSDSSSESAPNPDGSSAVMIAAVQVAGAQASNDYVKLYNAGNAAADISGWKLRKRSQSGAEYSIRTFPQGSIIPARAYFVWANSDNGFAASIGADASSTATLAADNSVAILDADGNVIDALAWGTGSGQYAEGNPFPTDPAAGQILGRNNSGGDLMDTRDNATDFFLQ